MASEGAPCPAPGAWEPPLRPEPLVSSRAEAGPLHAGQVWSEASGRGGAEEGQQAGRAGAAAPALACPQRVPPTVLPHAGGQHRQPLRPPDHSQVSLGSRPPCSAGPAKAVQGSLGLGQDQRRGEGQLAGTGDCPPQGMSLEAQRPPCALSFPDVMMPAYARSPWSCVFFIVYLSIELYFIMNLVRPGSRAGMGRASRAQWVPWWWHRHGPRLLPLLRSVLGLKPGLLVLVVLTLRSSGSGGRRCLSQARAEWLRPEVGPLTARGCCDRDSRGQGQKP